MCDANELRAKNRATIEEFFKRHGEARAELFAQDGCKELTYAANGGEPQRWEGKEEVLKNFTANKTFFPKWGWSNLTIDDTQDPNKFWVEGYGGGEQQIADAPEPTKYENHYIFGFKMKDGLILEMREFNNPLKLMQAFGVELPKMPDAKKDTDRLLEE